MTSSRIDNRLTRRCLLRSTATGLAAVAGGLAVRLPNGVRAAEGSQPSRKPNFVIIIADDMTWHDAGCWGNKDVRTPNLDRLAAQGMRLVNMFTPAPMCAPCRQALYTGLFPVRNGAHPNHSRVYDGVKSMPHHLRPLGYRVGLVGKTHFGPRESFPFENPAAGAGKAAKGDGEAKPAKGAKKGKRSQGGESDGGASAVPGAVGSGAAGAIRNFIARDKGEPFCLVVASNEPHGPWTLGDASVYDPDKLTLPPYLVDTPATRRALAAYYAEIEVFDRQVGQVMRILDQTGQADNTLVLVLSEQGSGWPHCKWTLYDAGIRVAAVARWPGRIKPGSTCQALMQYVDVLPTFLAAAGATPPADLDGRSFLDALTGRSDRCRDTVFAVQTSRGIINGPEAYGIRCARDSRYKYILNLNHDSQFQNVVLKGDLFKSWQAKADAGDAFARSQVDRYLRRPAVEFYDVQSDPYEMKDLSAEPSLEAERKRLRAQLDTWMKQQGDRGAATEMDAKERQKK